MTATSQDPACDELERLEEIVVSRRLSMDEIAAKTRAIHDEMLRRSPNIREGNFTAISARDLTVLSALYDERFLDGLLKQAVNREERPKLAFRVATRMTSAGGKTILRQRRARGEPTPEHEKQLEIAVSSTLLFQTFLDVDRRITVNGLVCRDRLEALQRVFEHELIHLLELLLWGASRCAAPRFQELARRHFGHTEVTHRLVTQRERAAERFGIRVGDRVSFELEGIRYQGIVNRITKRATVIVPSDAGLQYSDGQRYLKYYVPIGALERRE